MVSHTVYFKDMMVFTLTVQMYHRISVLMPVLVRVPEYLSTSTSTSTSTMTLELMSTSTVRVPEKQYSSTASTSTEYEYPSPALILPTYLAIMPINIIQCAVIVTKLPCVYLRKRPSFDRVRHCGTLRWDHLRHSTAGILFLSMVLCDIIITTPPLLIPFEQYFIDQ